MAQVYPRVSAELVPVTDFATQQDTHVGGTHGYSTTSYSKYVY